MAASSQWSAARGSSATTWATWSPASTASLVVERGRHSTATPAARVVQRHGSAKATAGWFQRWMQTPTAQRKAKTAYRAEAVDSWAAAGCAGAAAGRCGGALVTPRRCPRSTAAR